MIIATYLTTDLGILGNLLPFLSGANETTANMSSLNIEEFAIRGIINLISIFILARLIYFIRHKDTDFLFTLVIFNAVNFLICYLLSGANLEVGFAFGLFAIFSIMRYRTVTLPVKEMGFLFVAVAMGLLNSLALNHGEYLILVLANVFILITAYLLDRTAKNHHTKTVIYERINLIKPENKHELIKDLKERTGLPIRNVEIVDIDFMKDIAHLKIRY